METILYGIVIEFENGGQQMENFLKEESAVKEGERVVKAVIDSGRKGLKVYLTELPYDKYNNRLLTSDLVNEGSRLLISS